MKIIYTSLVKDILDNYPETFDTFLSNGFRYKSIEALVDSVGIRTMLKTVLTVKSLNIDLFIHQLEEIIEKTKNEKTYLLKDFNSTPNLNVYGNTICPLRFNLKDKVEEIIQSTLTQTGDLLQCYIDAKASENGKCEETFIGNSIEKFPELIISKEFNDYFSKQFIDNYLGKDDFTYKVHKNIHQEILDAQILDPLEEYVIYALMAEVFLIDLNTLGDLPIPKTTKDLLNPIYKDKIVIFGKSKDELSNLIFLYINKKFGEKGLEKLAHNVVCSLHGSQMSKAAGRKSKNNGAIYLVSWFFAQTCSKKNIAIIWPEDGAMTLPLFLLAKKSRSKGVDEIIDYILGEEFGDYCVKANTPVINGNVDNNLPKGAKFQWIGWDYIRENDMYKLTENNEKIFMEYWHKYHPLKEIFHSL